MILVIDDVKTFPFPENVEVIYARTLEDAYVKFINNEHLDQLWLDHDLGNDEDIRPLCLILAELGFNGTPRDIGKIVICSLNPVGIDWMWSTLSPYYELAICNDPKAVFDLLGSNEAIWY